MNELSYLPDATNPSQRQLVHHCFTIVARAGGPGGPEKMKNHDLKTITFLANSLAQFHLSKGLDPVGLNPNFSGLQHVFRAGDPDADLHREPVDFYSPDTFNYATLGVSDDGKLLTAIFIRLWKSQDLDINKNYGKRNSQL